MTEQDVFFNTFDEMWTEKEIQHVYAENLNYVFIGPFKIFNCVTNLFIMPSVNIFTPI